MSSMIQPDYGARVCAPPTAAREAKQTGTQGGSFLALAARAAGAAGTQQADAAQRDAYKKYLENRFGPVTIRSVGKDQASLEAAGKRMSGNDVVIAPNIFEEMVSDPQKAAFYEQKISYFFTDVIPKGTAFAACVGLTFEPCGVVIHEDGTVTYICGGGDTPERVAEVNRINRERDAKRAAERKLYQARAEAAAAQRRDMWAQEEPFLKIGGLLETRAASAPVLAPEIPLPAGTEISFLSLQ